MATRKLTPTAKAAGATPEPKIETQTAWDKLQDAVAEYFQAEGLPSWKRQITSFMLGLLSYGVTLYVGVSLTDILISAALMYSGPGFIAFMALFIGFTLSLIAATTAGYAVFNMAMSFEAGRLGRRVHGWFSRKETSHA